MALLQVDYAGWSRSDAEMIEVLMHGHIGRGWASEEVTDSLPANVRACLQWLVAEQRLANGDRQFR